MTPRTDPGERNYRTGLLPRVFGVKAYVGVRMIDFGCRDPLPDDWPELLPVYPPFLASTPQHLQPVPGDLHLQRVHGLHIT